jgi:hypothetical protein
MEKPDTKVAPKAHPWRMRATIHTDMYVGIGKKGAGPNKVNEAITEVKPK